MGLNDEFVKLLKTKDFSSGYEKKDDELAKEIASVIDKMVNNFSFNRKELIHIIVNDYKTKYNFLTLSIAWIKYLHHASKVNVLYDGRNEMACKVGYEVYLCPSFSKYSNMTNYDGFNWYEEPRTIRKWEYENACKLDICGHIVTNLWNIHKTLQQSFSGLVFHFLSYACDDLNKEIVNMKGYKDWYLLPMI